MTTLLRQNIAAAQQLIEQLVKLEPQVDQAARLIAGALTAGHKLLTCGNGGSAADAAHLATEFVCRYCEDRRPYPAVALTNSGGDLTAIANDYHFAEVFARQVHAYARPGDVLVAFTTSGQSENIRRALVAARTVGVSSIAFLGRDGGRCAGLAEVELLVPAAVTARIQEAHKLLLHTLCEMVEPSLSRDPLPIEPARREAGEQSP